MLLLLCMPVHGRIRAMTVDGVVGRRGWWRMMMLHGWEQSGATPNELPPESSCDNPDLDASTVHRTMLPVSLRGVGGRVNRRE